MVAPLKFLSLCTLTMLLPLAASAQDAPAAAPQQPTAQPVPAEAPAGEIASTPAAAPSTAATPAVAPSTVAQPDAGTAQPEAAAMPTGAAQPKAAATTPAAPEANPAASASELNRLIVCEPIGRRKNDDPIGPILFRLLDIPQVLDLLQQYSGRVIIASDDLPKSRINFNSNGQLPREQAIYALESLLALNGVMLIPGEGKFVRASSLRDPARRATPIIEEIPDGAQSGQVFSKIFQLKYLAPEETIAIVRNFTSGYQTSRIQRVDSTNSIMVVDTLSNLSTIENLLNRIDQPAGTSSKVYTFDIRHGSAARIRETLRQIQNSAFSPWLGNSSVWIDNRTNKLIVITRPENHSLLQSLIEDLDKEVAPFTTSQVIRIKDGNYWQIWQIVNTLIRTQRRQFDAMGFRSTEQTVTRTGATEEQTAAQPTTPAEGAAEQPAAVPQQTAATTTIETTTVSDSAMPEMQFSPYVAVFPDYANSAIVVYGTHNDISRMERLLEQLDIKSAPYVASEVIEIKHAHIREVSQMLSFIINSQRQSFARKGFQSGASSQQAEAAHSEGEGGFQFSDFATVAADWRRNSILVYGTRQDIAQVSGLINELDQPAAPITRNEVLYLKHARADNIARMIVNIITYQRNVFTRTRNVSQSEGDNATAQETLNGVGFEFSDYAVVYADRRSNALFIYGTHSDITRVKQMVTDADIPVEPITQTRIFALRHTDANQSASIIQRIVNAQRQALTQVRSEGREVANPAAKEDQQEETQQLPVSEGEESLQFSPFMTVTPDVRSNSLVVYGTAGDVKQIEELLTQIDIEVSPFTQSRVFFLKNAQSSSLIGILNNVVLGQQRALARVRSRNREIQNTRNVGNLGTGAEDSALQFSPYVTIVENRRNNAIIVYGTPSDIAQVSELIETNDVAIAPYTQTRTFHIRYAEAIDTARTITTLINQQQRVREREATLQRVFRRGSAAGGARDEDALTNAATPADAVSAQADEALLAAEFDPNAGADLQFSPYVSLVADERSNTVIAYGTQFDLGQIENLISQIDKVLPQVRIEVVIAEVRLQGNQVSGLSSFGINYRNPFDFQRVRQTVAGTTNEQIIGTTGLETGTLPISSANNQAAFDLGLSLNDFSLTTVFRVAQEDSNVKVLSAPTITTTHNRRAQINVGEARPIITGTTTNNNSSDLVTRSTVEYRDIGITLRVRPLVSESGAIQMELEQIVETVISEQTIDNNVQPIISTRRASSFVSVQDREIIIMGGLQSVETTKREGKVFLLGDIPLLGELFRPERDEEIVRELIIFIRPYLESSADAETFMEENKIDKKAVGEDIRYFLENNRFREQDEMRERNKTKEKAQEDQMQDDTAAPAISGSAANGTAPNAAANPSPAPTNAPASASTADTAPNARAANPSDAPASARTANPNPPAPDAATSAAAAGNSAAAGASPAGAQPTVDAVPASEAPQGDTSGARSNVNTDAAEGNRNTPRPAYRGKR